MNVEQLNAIRTQTAPVTSEPGRGFGDLGQADFFRLLTVQIQQQDPFEPVDNKEMLAQMAQFSGLAGITESNETLQAISAKLDALIAAQASAQAPAEPGADTTQTTPVTE